MFVNNYKNLTPNSKIESNHFVLVYYQGALLNDIEQF